MPPFRGCRHFEFLLNSMHTAENAVTSESTNHGFERVSDLVLMALNTQPVLGRRATIAYYGIQCPCLSVQEIGRLLQMDEKAVGDEVQRTLRRLRHPKVSGWLQKALCLGEDWAWTRITNAQGIVYKRDYPAHVLPRLPGEMLLAIACRYDAVTDWMSKTSHETTVAWVRCEFTESALREATEKLQRSRESISLPISVERLAEKSKIEERLLRTIIGLGNQLQMYLGYALEQPIRSRSMRAVRLHHMITEVWGQECASVSVILAEYHQRYSDDNCNWRDLETSMAEHPHLFLNLRELGWCGLGPAATLASAEDKETRLRLLLSSRYSDGPFFKWSQDRKRSLDTPARELIRALLEEMAPCRFDDLTRKFNARYPDRASTERNLLIIGRDHYIRLAPRLFGLRGRDEDLPLTQALRDLLLNRTACSTYIICRHFGGASFPLWTPAMEREWCHWAESRLPKFLFHSLLGVAQPNLWPATDGERTVWSWKKECLGRFCLKPQRRRRLAERLPDLRDVYRLLRALFERERLNWVQANSILGTSRPTDQAVLSSLAILAGLRALTAPPEWTGPHVVAPDAKIWKDRLTEELHRKGRLAWSEGSGLEMLTTLAAAAPPSPLGWVDPGEFLLLIKTLQDGPSEAAP